MTLNQALSELPKDKFVKITTVYAVALDRIHTIVKDRVTLNTTPAFTFPILRKYEDEIMERLDIIGSVVAVYKGDENE
jgi:hypothetical protein